MQLRYLQTLSEISAENNSTIIFPLPIELLGGLLGAGSQQKNTKDDAQDIAGQISE